MLRSANKRDVAFRESGLIRRIRRQVRRINEATLALRLGLNVPSGAAMPPVDFTRAQYTRIFNRNFHFGGRLFRAWWQSLPKEQRKWITINEQPTIEIDVSNCHPKLLRALMGLEPHADDFDMYAIQGVPRNVAKRAFYAIVHTGNRTSAIRALADGLRATAPDVSARHVVDAMLAQRPELRSASGQPGRLQFLDSKFCVKILPTCFDRGIPAVSVHDSFVVPARFEDDVRALVDKEFEALCARLHKAAVCQRSRARSRS